MRIIRQPTSNRQAHSAVHQYICRRFGACGDNQRVSLPDDVTRVGDIQTDIARSTKPIHAGSPCPTTGPRPFLRSVSWNCSTGSLGKQTSAAPVPSKDHPGRGGFFQRHLLRRSNKTRSTRHAQRRHRLHHARAPIGRAYRGAFNDTQAQALGGHVVAEAVRRTGVAPAEVDDVIIWSSALQQGAPEFKCRTSMCHVARAACRTPIAAHVGGSSVRLRHDGNRHGGETDSAR